MSVRLALTASSGTAYLRAGSCRKSRRELRAVDGDGGSSGRFAAMQILQGVYFGFVAGHRADAESGSTRRGKGGDARNVIAYRGAANRFFVIERFAAEGRIDEQIHLARFYEVHDIRTAFVHLVNGFHFDAGLAQSGGGAARGDYFQSSGNEVSGHGLRVLFVPVTNAHEHNTF